MKPTETEEDKLRWQCEEDVAEVACHAVRWAMQTLECDEKELAFRMGMGTSPELVRHRLAGSISIRDLAHMAQALGCKVEIRLEAAN